MTRQSTATDQPPLWRDEESAAGRYDLKKMPESGNAPVPPKMPESGNAPVPLSIEDYLPLISANALCEHGSRGHSVEPEGQLLLAVAVW